jgi:hypothetical protein
MARRGAGRVICNGKEYRSQKHPLLEYIFHKYNPTNDTSLESIPFTLADISEAYRAVQVFRIDSNGNQVRVQEPASISNTILDLVRQNRGIQARIPDSIIELGYDLRKKTGGNNAGEFVFVGKGNELSSWLTWSSDPERISIDSSSIPSLALDFIRKDEGALFSVIDYCDVLSQALYGKLGIVVRVQHPLKWQPNEIDGFYAGIVDGVETLFPIEAKALTTHDEINLDQILGGINTISLNLQDTHAHIVPMAVKMISNGILIAVFSTCEAGEFVEEVEVERTIEVTFNPPINSWQ